MLSQSFLFCRKQTHLCVCIIFKITCETKSQVSGNFPHSHTPLQRGGQRVRTHTTSLVHAAHCLTLINDFPSLSPLRHFRGSSHIKFSTRKPETVQAKAAFYGSTRGEAEYYGIPDAFMAWKLLLFTKPWTLWSLKWKFASERKLSTANSKKKGREGDCLVTDRESEREGESVGKS